MKITTNNREVEPISWFDLPEKWIKEFDYIETEQEKMDAFFFKSKGSFYDIAQFTTIDESSHLGELGWHAMAHETAFSGVLIKINEENDTIVIGRYCA